MQILNYNRHPKITGNKLPLKYNESILNLDHQNLVIPV